MLVLGILRILLLYSTVQSTSTYIQSVIGILIGFDFDHDIRTN